MYNSFRYECIASLVTLLPPTYEVWGKVMFLRLCVILFTWGGVSVPACITDHMTGVVVSVLGGCLCPSMHHRSHDRGGGFCPGGVSLSQHASQIT